MSAAAMSGLFLGVASRPQKQSEPACRYLPGDCHWPKDEKWNRLNDTTGGKLIRSFPLAQACHMPIFDPGSDICIGVQKQWTSGQTYYENSVHVMSPYWLNGSCSPFEASNTGCTLGNIAVYALEIDGPATVKAGLEFARENNIRLSIKNTGHDYLGRSSGRGSLALWTHKLKDITFLDYSSPHYSGPALRVGAGIQFSEAYSAAETHGLRITGGYCPTVGFAGGYVQHGGHGPLAASYGLAADNALEFEVVTTDGRHLTASATENSDLYWALSGGGPGNYGVVLSLTTKAYADGPTAGATLAFINTDPDKYWKAVGAFQSHLLALDEIHGFATSWGLDNQAFSVDVATLPNGTQSDIQAALNPFIKQLEHIGLALAKYNTTLFPSFYSHYKHYEFPPEIYSTNNTLGGCLVPRSTIKNSLPQLIDAFCQIAESPQFPVKRSSGNSVSVSRQLQQQVNKWQDLFRPLRPGGGAYASEATFDNPNWKEDYFGRNYDRLLKIKMKYDPKFALWQHTSVGADAYWKVTEAGRLCRVP
ncbi:unnamed protein product, partial [Clonostachys rhizophaga]